MRIVFKLLVLAVSAALLVSGCSLPSEALSNTPSAITAPPAAIVVDNPTPQASAEQLAASGNADTGWQADGVIRADEYDHSASAGRMTVYWANDDSFLYIALQARTSGWLSIGFDPDRTHKGADIIIGAVTGGKVVLLDSYGTSERGTYHMPDTELGGSDDIVTYYGTNEGGITTIEFQLPLNSEDAYDKALQPGTSVPVILAYGVSSDLTSMHSFATFGELALDVSG